MPAPDTGYRREIDGLRAVAVLPVMAFHAGFPGFTGGFIGVDVFFVISGYLITGILLGDLQEGRYSIARFYERRARRILPALFVVIAASCAAGYALLLPPAFEDFSASVFAVLLFLSNMLFISEVDYFAPAAEETPLLHTWSLAVEEQFYILFPLILWGLWRMGRGRAVVWGIAVLGLASLAFSEWAWRVYPAQSFYFLPSRGWELLAGAACALVPHRWASAPRPVQEALALGGLIAILASVSLLHREIPFPSLWTVIPVGGSVAVILWARPGTLTARLLSLRVMVGIGLISYSAYLWHNPIYAYARIATEGTPAPLAMVGLFGLSLGLAALTWRFVEQPFRHQSGRKPMLATRGRVFAASGLGMAVLGGVAIWGYATAGRAELWLRSASPETRQTYALFAAARIEANFADDGDCRFNQRTVTEATRDRLRDCARRFGPGLAVIGDSHAINLADALIEARAAPFIFGMTQGNCRPDSPRDQCDFDGFAALMAETPGLFSRVVFEVAGQRLIEGMGGRRTERIFDLYPPGTEIPPSEVHVLTDLIAANTAYLQGLAAHVSVIWLTPRIEPQLDDAHIMAHGCSHAFALRPGQAELFRRIGEAITAELSGVHPALRVLDQPALIDFTMPRDFMTCEALHWSDGDHLSVTGRAWLAARLAPVLVP